MRIECPDSRRIPEQRQLWQQVFGDSDAFLDSFFSRAYVPERCRCILIEDNIAAVLYWMDCSLDSHKLAYLYAVATHPAHRGRGLCRQLMADTHEFLSRQGYAGVVLVPQDEGLRRMYGRMGYQDAGGLDCFTCTAGASPLPLRAVGPGEFAALRRQLLPPGSVVQEGEGLAFLAEQLQFFAGQDFLLAGFADQEQFHAMELLGNRQAAAGILNTLGCGQGHFRCPGTGRPFAMFCPLIPQASPPAYFGFAFD